MAEPLSDQSGRDDRGYIITVAEIRRVGAEILTRPERQHSAAFDDLMTDTIGGIAFGESEDPVAMCRELCVVGGAICRDPEVWLAWMGESRGA